MSVHQNVPSELGTQNSTVGYAPLNATQKDERGTPPIRLDPLQTMRLRLMFLTSRYLRMANEEMKNMLFTHPFEVFLGANQQNVLKQTFKETIISEYWMPALRKIHDWLIQFGVAPYRIRPVKFPSISPQFDIGAFRKAGANKSSSLSSRSKKPNEPYERNEEEKEEEEEEPKSTKIPNIMMETETPNKNKNVSSTHVRYVSYGEEIHNVVDVPDFDCGFVSTYVDSKFKQQFLWTWNPNAVPQTFDNRNGYTDPDVKFIVKDPPTIKGEYTCPLRTSIKEWIYLNSRKKMDSLSMRDRLNPVIFVEKQEPHALKTPSVIDELSVNYSSSFNSGRMNYRPSGSNGSSGLDLDTGEMNLGFGKSVKFDATRIDGLTDVGLTTYSDGYGSNGPPDYATLVSTLEFNRRATGGVGSGSGINNVPFGFGGINDDELTTDLGGLMTTFGSDPIMTNPMSGIGYRVKKMNEGEKITEIKNNELNAYVNVTTIEQQERSLEESLCFLAGYPATFITGRSGGGGGGKGGGGKAGGGDGTKGTPSSSSSPGSFATSSDNDASKGFLIGRLRHFKVYYQQQIAKLFLQCYADSFMKSKIKLLNQLEENHWFILEQVYALKIDLPVDPPPMDSSSLMNNFGSGMVTLEEVVRNTRLNLGLSLDVMEDEEFMNQAKKRLESKYDAESQLKLQRKYATKSEGNKEGKGESKKRKATSEAKKSKNDGKKAKH
jgi:hypothetical protein